MSREHAVQRASAPAPDMASARAVGVRPPALGTVEDELNDSPRVRQLAAIRSDISAAPRGVTAQRAPRSAAERAPSPARGVVQRALNAVFFNPPPAALQAKMDAVLATINRMGATVVPAIHLNLDITEDPQHLQTNPADTRIVPIANPHFRRIDMTIRSWYVETSSIGEIAGMIGHELGVHSLTDIEMTGAERAAETAQDAAPYTATVAGAPRPLAPINGDRRQDDHVRVAKFVSDPVDPQPDLEPGDAAPLMDHDPAAADVDDANAPRVARQPLVPMPRMEGYIQTMLRMGDAIEAAPVGAAANAEYADAAAREQAQREMFQTFLFDLGRLIATDDGNEWAVATGLGSVAAVFNWLRGYLVGRFGAAHPWLNQMAIADATVAVRHAQTASMWAVFAATKGL